MERASQYAGYKFIGPLEIFRQNTANWYPQANLENIN